MTNDPTLPTEHLWMIFSQFWVKGHFRVICGQRWILVILDGVIFGENILFKNKLICSIFFKNIISAQYNS